MESESARERTDSVSSTKIKRTVLRRDESSSDSDVPVSSPRRRRSPVNIVEATADKMREVVNGLMQYAKSQNKSSRMTGPQTGRIVEDMESLLEQIRIMECEAAFMQGRLHERINIEQCLLRVEKEVQQRSSQVESGAGTERKMTYGEALKAPKIGKKPIPARDQEKVLLIYPTDKNKNADEIKKMIKDTLEPRKDKIQVRNVRKTQRGAVVVETGSREDVKKIRTITEKIPTIRVDA